MLHVYCFCPKLYKNQLLLGPLRKMYMYNIVVGRANSNLGENWNNAKIGKISLCHPKIDKGCLCVCVDYIIYNLPSFSLSQFLFWLLLSFFLQSLFPLHYLKEFSAFSTMQIDTVSLLNSAGNCWLWTFYRGVLPRSQRDPKIQTY